MGPLPAAWGHVLNARFVSAENALIDAVGSGALRHAGGRAFAHLCTGLLALMARNDTTAAAHAVAAFFAEVDAAPDAISNVLRVRGHALAALVTSTPDGRHFAPEKVFAHATAVRDGVDDEVVNDSRALAAVAEAWCRFHLGRRHELQACLERRRRDLASASSFVPRLLRDHLLALSSALDGFQPDASRRLQALAASAREVGFHVGEARCLARLCMASHITGAPRDDVRQLGEAHQQARTRGQLQPSFSDLLAGAAHAEALHGLGRFDDAARIVDDVERTSQHIQWPAADILLVQSRLAFQLGGVERVHAMATAFSTRWEALGRASIDACVLFLRALCEQMEGEGQTSAKLFMEAHDLAVATGVRPWLEHMSAGLALASCAYHALFDDAGAALQRFDRSLERTPSPWFSAVRNHIVGVLRSAEHRGQDAKQSLQTAIATLELCGEVTETARARRSLAVVARVLDDDDAEALFKASDKEMAALGIPVTDLHTREGAARIAARRRRRPVDGGERPHATLAVGVQRLAVRGLSPEALARELVDVVHDVVGSRAAVVDVVTGEVWAGAPVKGKVRTTEFGDGSGRRFQLAVPSRLAPAAFDQVTTLVTTASLAFEVNAMRAVDDPKTSAIPLVAPELPQFIAASDVMRDLVADLQRLGRSLATVLVVGESGTGKEEVARAVHTLSSRRDGPYVTFNCAAVPRDLVESQLFGHIKGAFTGADRNQNGVVRDADGGTLFLDEVGELPLDVQAKLLRFLENREVHPLGASRPRRVDVRIVAATHRDLDAMVQEGAFRQDLLFRLQVVPLSVPPLRERRDDVLPLVHFFLRRFTPDGEDAPRLHRDTVMTLLAHDWPGNVRELRNVIERCLAFSPTPSVLLPDDLRLAPRKKATPPSRG